jgi:hypothetical protein
MLYVYHVLPISVVHLPHTSVDEPSFHHVVECETAMVQVHQFLEFVGFW